MEGGREEGEDTAVLVSAESAVGVYIIYIHIVVYIIAEACVL